MSLLESVRRGTPDAAGAGPWPDFLPRSIHPRLLGAGLQQDTQIPDRSGTGFNALPAPPLPHAARSLGEGPC